MDNNALFNIGYGLYVLSSKNDNKDNACIINTVSQIASNPCVIAFSVNKMNLTHDMIKQSKIANISILTEKSDFEIFKHFGYQSGKNTEKFQDFNDIERSKNGLLYITKNTNAYISLSIENEIEFSSHTLFIAKMADAKILNNDKTVSYDFYQKNLKPQNNAKKTGWICKICNYIYENDDLPSDFICPICKHPASDFIKL